MTSRRLWVSMSLTAVMLALGATVQAAGDKPNAPRRDRAAHQTGTVLDAGIASLNLDADTLAKVTTALAPWKEKNAAAKVAAASQADVIKSAMKEERSKGKTADKAKLADLKKQLDAVENSLSPADQYKSARDLLKGVLTDEQLTKVDAGAREATFGTATKMFDTQVANWSKKGVELTPEQKDKVVAVQGKLKDELAKLDVGSSPLGVVSQLMAEAKATLPQGVQDKIGKRATSRPVMESSK